MTIPRSILAIALALAIVGCGSTPRERVANAEKVYAGSARTAATLIRSGAINDPKLLNAIGTASSEANVALADANSRVRDDDKSPTAKYWADRAADAIERLAVLIGGQK
jgi:type II secretory pathway pseudopilin PulG